MAKEGWLRPLRKSRAASLAGADGVVGSTSDNRWLERTTPSAPQRNGVILLMARPPLLCQGGEFAFPLVRSSPTVPSSNLWDMLSGSLIFSVYSPPSPASGGFSGNRATSTLSTRLPSMSTTSNRWPSASNASPVTGTRPTRNMTRPPSV